MSRSTSPQRRAATLLLCCCLFPAAKVSLGADEAKKMAVDKEVAAFLKQIRSDDVRDAAKRQAEELKTGSAATKKDAVLFFHDLRARSLLLELLAADDWAVQSAVADNCMDVFQLDDLPRLYQIAASAIVMGGKAEEKIIVARKKFVEKLSRAAAAILAVKVEPLKDFSKQGIHAWWGHALKEAKKKPTKKAALVTSLLHVIENDTSK